MLTPADLGVPHGAWRPKQYETFQWALDVEDFGCCEQPVGSGKSAVAKALSSRQSVIVLTKRKSLQGQYKNLYLGDVLVGKSNYRCIHPDAPPGTTCADCLHAEEGMHKCSYWCGYRLAKARLLSSPFGILNYSYWMTAHKFREKHSPQVLVLDEGHNLSDEVTAFCGCTITDRERIEWSLPHFPVITHRCANVLLRLPPPADIALPWLREARGVVAKQYRQLRRAVKQDKHNEKARARMRKAERIGSKLRNALDALIANADDWFIRSGLAALTFGQERRPGFVAKPLTARFHFGRYFLNDHATIAMSATIGDPATFAAELGVKEYDWRVVPSRFPPEDRPVQVLDVPPMSRKPDETPNEHQERFGYQADAIAKAILGCDPTWSGLIHVTRKREAALLADRLARRGLQERIWVTPGWDGSYTPTDQQLTAWQERRRRVRGSLCVTWAMAEGYDGLDEKICISAKVPFGFLGSEYVEERMHYDRRMYAQRTAWQFEQSLGRTRRGRDEDYGPGTGLVCIADGSWSQVRKYLSQSMQEAIIE